MNVRWNIVSSIPVCCKRKSDERKNLLYSFSISGGIERCHNSHEKVIFAWHGSVGQLSGWFKTWQHIRKPKHNVTLTPAMKMRVEAKSCRLMESMLPHLCEKAAATAQQLVFHVKCRESINFVYLTIQKISLRCLKKQWNISPSSCVFNMNKQLKNKLNFQTNDRKIFHCVCIFFIHLWSSFLLLDIKI